MGNAESTSQMEKTLFNLKYTSKQLARESSNCKKKQAAEVKKLQDAIKSGDPETARIYATNAIREKNQALNFLRLSSRIDAVASRVETAVRMKTLTKQLSGVVHGMDSVLATMDPEKIAAVMDKFEKQFESLDVRSAYMDTTMAESTSTSIPEDEVNTLVMQVAETNNLDLSEAFADLKPRSGVTTGAAAAAAPARVSEVVGAAAAPAKDDSKKGGDGSSGDAGAGSGGGGASASSAPRSGGGGGGGGGADFASLEARFAALRK